MEFKLSYDGLLRLFFVPPLFLVLSAVLIKFFSDKNRSIDSKVFVLLLLVILVVIYLLNYIGFFEIIF